MDSKDPLAAFDFDQVSKPGLFLKFQAGKSVTLRVLTLDPVLQEQEFEDKVTGEITNNLKFNFIVYNFTDDKAQIWGATSAMSRKIGELHNDADFGANIRNMDIKITPTGEKKERRYDMQVLRHSGNQTPLTAEQIKEAQAINLDSIIENGSRMSIWKKPEEKPEPSEEPQPGYDKAKAQAEAIKERQAETDIASEPATMPFEGTEINLDEIPF